MKCCSFAKATAAKEALKRSPPPVMLSGAPAKPWRYAKV